MSRAQRRRAAGKSSGKPLDFFKALGCTKAEFCAAVSRQLRDGGPPMGDEERADLAEREALEARGELPAAQAGGLEILRLRRVLAIQNFAERQAAWIAMCRVENLLN